MADPVPPTSTPADVAGTGNRFAAARNRLGKAVGAAQAISDPKAAAGAAAGAAVSKVAGKVPYGKYLGDATEIAGDLKSGDLKGAAVAGVKLGAKVAFKTTEKSIEAAASATGAGAAVVAAYEVAKKVAQVALKNKYVRYMLIGAILLPCVCICGGIYNTATTDPIGFYFENREFIEELRTNDLSSLNTGVCISSGSGDSANTEGRDVAEETHTQNDPIMEDCLRSKAAAKTIEKE